MQASLGAQCRSLRACCSSPLPAVALPAFNAPWKPRQHRSTHYTSTAYGTSGCSSLKLLRGRIHGQQQKCHAAADDGQGGDVVYEGMYGPWRIEQEDIFEVWSYRVGLTVTVAAFVAAATICSTTDPSAAAAALNPLALLGAAAFGVSLMQIHIYLTPIKRTLQALWALGVAGGCYLALSHGEQPLPLLVAQQAWSVWFVGPVAAAATGVGIKEGLCYGKPEAAGVALLLPLLCLTHLSGLAPAELEQALLVSTCGVAAVFAGRKYSQPIKDDIGDKSVFMYMKQQRQQQEGQ